MTATDATLPHSGAVAPDPAPSRRPRSRAMKSLMRNPSALFGGALVVIFIVVALAAPLVAPYAPTASSSRVWTRVGAKS